MRDLAKQVVETGVVALTELTPDNFGLFEGMDYHVYSVARECVPHLTLNRWWPGHWRVKETDLGYIDVVRMLTNHRLCLTDFDNCGYAKGYCFNGPKGLSEALKAADAWDGMGEVGGRWYRAIHTDVKRPEYING